VQPKRLGYWRRRNAEPPDVDWPAIWISAEQKWLPIRALNLDQLKDVIRTVSPPLVSDHRHFAGMILKRPSLSVIKKRGSKLDAIPRSRRKLTLKALAKSSPGFALKPWGQDIPFSTAATLKGLRSYLPHFAIVSQLPQSCEKTKCGVL
jgi:hypothetical protein